MAEKQLQVKELTPLALLYCEEHHQIEGRTRMQKLVFLAQDQLEGIDTLEYFAYKYGPFSKDLIESIEKFQSMGLLEREKVRSYGGSEKYIYSLTPKGSQSFKYNLEQGPNAETLQVVLAIAEGVMTDHNRKSLNKLIEFVYDEHPEFAAESIY